jgi:hypothetical protein
MDNDVAARLTLGVGLTAFVTLIAYFCWWCYRAWPRIWGAPRTAFENTVYRFGARGFGLSMWLLTTVVERGYDGIRAHEPGRWWILQFGLRALCAFPMYLWLGYWWGRGMAAFFGVKDSARAV